MKLLHPLLIMFFVTNAIAAFSQSNSFSSKPVQQYSIEQFHKTTQAVPGSFSSDEKKLLLMSSESGIMNGYEIDIASGAKRPLFEEGKPRVFPQEYLPGTNDIVYQSSPKQNGKMQLYLLRSDGTRKQLTNDSVGSNEFFDFLDADRFLYYTSNKRDERFFDLYKMDTSAWTSTFVFRNDSAYGFAGATKDGRRLLLSKRRSYSTNDLYLYDFVKDQYRQINPEGKEAAYKFLWLTPDGKYLYYATDEGSEFHYVVRYNISTGKAETYYQNPNYDVTGMIISPDEKIRAFSLFEDGRIVSYFYDHKTGKQLHLLKGETASAISIWFSSSGKKMRFIYNESRSPFDIGIYDFESRKLKRLTQSLNPEINKEDLVEPTVVRYKSFDGTVIPAVLYTPHGASRKNKVPAVVIAHGGPGGMALRNYQSTAQFLVNHGYAVLDVNYRGSDTYGKTFAKLNDKNVGDGDVKDLVWSKNYLSGLPYIDGEKVAVMGYSFGGYMTLASLAFHPDAFAAGVDFYGVSNWHRTLKNMPPSWEAMRIPLYTKLGDPNSSDSIRLKQFSPLYHAAKIKKPLLVLQGAKDQNVLQIESDDMVERVRKNGVPVEYIVFPDESHGFRQKQNQYKADEAVLKFLDTYVKKKHQQLVTN